MSDEFLTVAEVAERLKVNEQTVRNWIDRGELQATRIGRRVRVLTSALDAYLGRSNGDAATEGGTPQRPTPKTRAATGYDIKVVERLISTMVVTSAGLTPGSPLQRELAESAGRLQVALRMSETRDDFRSG